MQRARLGSRRTLSTYARLNLLAASALIPMVMFAAVVLYAFSRAEQARYQQDASAIAQRASAAIDRELTGLEASLEALATSPALQPGGSLEAFYNQARAVLRRRGTFIALRDQSGQQIINSSLPFGTPLPHATDPVLLAADREVFATGRLAITDLFTGTTTRLRLVMIETPVVQADRVVYALGISLDPLRLSDDLMAWAPPDWTLCLIDRSHRIVARSQEHERFVGSDARAGIEANEAGGTSGATLAGYTAQTVSDLTGWRVQVSIPASAIEVPMHRLILQLSVAGLLALLLAAALAARCARNISQPLVTLSDAAVRLGRGAGVAAISTGLREADQVGARLSDAAREIQQRELALQASEERFRAAVRAVEGVIWTNDANGQMTGEQRGWQTLTGQSQEEYWGYGWSKALHPDDAEPTIHEWEQAVQDCSTFVFEHRVRVASGAYRLFSIRAVPVLNVDGAIREWVGVHTDITTSREIQASLAESRARLRAVFEAAPVGLVVAEAPSGRVIDGNAQTERIMRHPIIYSADVEGYRAWTAYHADGRQVEGHEYPLGRILSQNEDRAELEVLYERGDGTRAWIRLVGAAIRDDAGGVTGAIVAILDIDTERRATAELQELNATLEQRVASAIAERDRMWHLSKEMMLVARAEGVEILAANPAWTTVLGWSEDELIGRSARDFIVAEDLPRALAESDSVAAGLVTTHFDRRYRCKDGGFRWLSWTAVPNRDLIYAIARDVTDEKAMAEALTKTEAQLRQSQKMEVVGQLTGGVAHDFNNLLTVVIGSLDVARRRLESTNAEARVLRNIGNAIDGAQRAATLTHRLLAFSRQSPLQPEVLDLNQSIVGMSELIRRTIGENVAVETVLAAGLWRAELDAIQVESAILNLCVNARDAMPGGGKLTLESANSYLDEGYAPVAAGSVSPGQYVVIAVSDTGHGIAADLQARVFEPFFTTKPVGKGTGLGLSQVYGFVRQSGGHAAIYSEVDHGTTVKLYFPRARASAPATEPQRPEAAAMPAASGETILVIEDEAMVREFTVAALEDAGYTVLAAGDGPSGLALLDRHPEIALLFTDIVLAGQLDGRKVADEALIRRPGLSVLFTTGYSRNAIIHGGRLDEGVNLLTKPFTARDLTQKIGLLLGS